MNDLNDPEFRAQISDPATLVALVGHTLPVAHSAVLKAATDPGAFTSEERTTLKGGLLTGGIAKTKISPEFVSTVLLLCGRRWGKGFVSTLLMIFDALFARHWQHVLPGQRIVYACVAPAMRQATETTRALVFWLDLLAPLGVAYERRDGNDQVEIVLTNPRLPAVPVFTIFAANSVALRGYPIGGLLLDEAGHFSAEEGNPSSAAEILASAKPGMLQFQGTARTILAGTPGQASGLFFNWANKPPKGALLIKAPSWSSGFYTRAQCLKEALDERHFKQEYEISRWGARDEACLERWQIRRCIDPERIARRPRSAPRVIVIDFAPRRDATAIAVARHELREGTESVLIDDVVVECIRELQGSREVPVLVDDVVDVVMELRKTYRGADMVMFDVYGAPEFASKFKKKGVRTQEIDVGAAQQTREWNALFGLVKGQRIVLPPNERMIDQGAGLRATELASGLLKIEGKRHDDIWDAIKSAAFRALTLPPSGTSVETVYLPIRFNGYQLSGGGVRHFRRLPNGQRMPIDPPVGSPGFDQWATTMKLQGYSTPTLEKYWAENPDEERPVDTGRTYARTPTDANPYHAFGSGTPLEELADMHPPGVGGPPPGWVHK